MQRLVALTINDPEHLAAFADEHAAIVDVAAGATSGGWGLGFFGHGEMLVRKTPLTRPRSALATLGELRARQLVLVADTAASLVSSRRAMQPLRYRDWVFAMTGGPADPAAFVAAARDDVRRFGNAGATVPEATLMVLMDALHRRGVLDARTPSTGPLHRALAEGMARVVALSGGREALAASAVLHVRGHLFALAVGRPLQVMDVTRRWREGSHYRELAATLVTDQALADPSAALTWSGLEVTEEGAAKPFALPL